MKLKEFIRSIGDRSLGLQERVYRLLVSVGLCGLVVSIVKRLLIGDDIRSTGMLAVAVVFFVGIFHYSLRFRKIQMGAVFIAVVMTLFVLPVTFLVSGGINGGTPIWFIFGLVYVCLAVEGKTKYILFAGVCLVDAACYYVAYAYPDLIFQHTAEIAYIDSVLSLVIVAVMICTMIIFQNELYRSENAVVRRQKQEIEELSRAQSRFFSSMSHEIRTPINTIIGLNELILREAVTEDVAADAGKIQAASKMLLALINDFLDMSKIQSGKMDILPAPYDVGPMLSDIVNMTWVRAKEKGIEFRLEVDQTIPAQLVGDEVRIKQILVNVLNNAVKYTQAGSVSLSVQCKGYQDGCAHMVYTITDTGIGVRKENIPYLFNAFERVDEEGNRHIEGTGLGLAIVKQLLELMGGDIAVNSVYMKGSSFVITLPQKTTGEAQLGDFSLESGQQYGTREQYRQSFEAPKAHVLIVDDNESNLMVAEKLLQDTKVQTDVAISGAACLEMTLQNRYDVILMDHLMPEMDGIECLHAVRGQTGGLNHSTPVVVLTANAGEEFRALYQKEGFDGYLLKPVSGVQLEAEVFRHLPKEIVSMTEEVPVSVVETPVHVHQRKLHVMISTDSVCDIPKELADKYQIAVMPYLVRTEGGEFLDGVEAETDGILSYMDRNGKNAQAVAPAVENYEEFFAGQLTKAQYIVHVTMAQKVSNGYANALEASRAFDNVTVIDSGNLSSGMGLMVLYAAKCAQNGSNAEMIADEISSLRSRIRTSFVLDSTEYLVRAGVLNSRLGAICKTFMLHPIIIIKNGKLRISSIRIGAKERVWGKYIAATLKGKKAIDTGTLFITYAGVTKGELTAIEEQVRERADFQDIIYQKASPATSINCGPGSFGLLFMTKR